MNDNEKTREQLIHELTELRSKNATQEKSITENISAQLAIEELQYYAENIVETIRQSLLVLDGDLKIISANRYFYSTFHVNPSETLGRFIYDLGYKQWDIPKLRELLEQILSEKEAFYDFEVGHHFQEIGQKIMMLNARQICRKEIAQKLILLAIEDITESKQAEEKLQASLTEGRRRQKTIEAIQAANHVALINRDLREIASAIFDQCKEATGATAGFTALLSKDGTGNEFLFQDPGAMLCEVDPSLPIPLRGLRREVQSAGRVMYDNDFSCSTWKQFIPAGHVPLHNVLMAPLTVKGEVLGFISFANKPGGFTEDDIPTVKAFAEIFSMSLINSESSESLKASEERYRSLVTATAQAVWLTNAQGEVVEDLPSWRVFTGQSEQEIKGMGWLDMLHPEDHEATAALWEESVVARSTYKTEYRVRRHDGEYRVMEARGVPVMEKDGSIQEWVGTCTDITERKEAENRSNATAVLLRSFVQTTSLREYLDKAVEQISIWSGCRCVGIRVLDKEGDIPYESCTGFSKEFWESENWLSTKKDQCACIRVVLGKPDPQDISCMTPKGSFYSNNTLKFVAELSEEEQARFRGPCVQAGFASVAVIPIRHQEKILGAVHLADKSGGKVPLKTIEFIESMTYLIGETVQRYAAEGALQKSESRLKFLADLLERSSQPYAVGYPDGRLGICNPAFSTLTGYSEQELKIMDWATELTPPEWWDSETRILEQLNRTGEPVRYEKEYIHKDGLRVPIELFVHKVDDEAGMVQYYYAFVTDITERKKAEEALQESERRFMDVLLSSKDAILLIDGEKFVECNETTARMLGYNTRDEFMKTHPSELSPSTQPDGRSSFEKANEMINAAFEKGFHQFEWEHRRANGENFPVEVSLTSILLHGENVLHCVWRDITEKKRMEAELQQTVKSLRKSLSTTVQIMVSTIEARDPYTAGHQLRVADLARTIATEMGLPPNNIEGLRMAGSIHDIGKISIPAEILSKPTKLSEIEFSLIKAHAQRGYEMLKSMESPWPLAEIVYQHHERMDGSGYPRNLKGEEICIEARILSVADVVEAMASHRPYRPGLGIDAALAEIEKNSGIFYDSTVADTCLRLFREKGFQLAEA